MSSLRIFHFEDDVNEAELIKDYLNYMVLPILKSSITPRFEDYTPFFDSFAIKHYKANGEAIEELEAHGCEYDLLILDLLEERKISNDESMQIAVGPTIAEVARGVSNAKFGIIGVSRVDSVLGFKETRNLFEKAARLPKPGKKSSYGVKFFSKSGLVDGSAQVDRKEFAQALIDVLIDAEVLKPRPPIVKLTYNTNDYKLRAVIEHITEYRLKEFTERFFGPETKECNVHYLRPGFSDAEVLRLENRDMSILLKTSRFQDSLQREVKNYPKINNALRGAFAQFKEKEVVNTLDGEWYAIAADFLADAVTFSERVEIESDVVKLQTLLYDFFINGLERVYSLPVEQNEPSNLLEAIFPSTSRSAKIHVAIEDLGMLAIRYGQSSEGKKFDSNILTNILFSKPHIGDISQYDLKRKPIYCLSHGDLHGRNILVTKSGARFWLIDPAHCGEWHWATDLARLMVDLIMSSWDKGPLAHTWEKFDQWRNLAVGMVNWEPTINAVGKSTTSPNIGVAATLDWIQENIYQIHHDRVGTPAPGGEFQLALAVEFMRSAYRIDLPTPKRVLGLVAAHDALLICEETFKRELGEKQNELGKEDDKEVKTSRPSSVSRDTVLNALNKLLVSQFESVWFKFNMPSQYKRKDASQVQQALDLIQYAEQTENGLEELMSVIATIQRENR